MAYLIQAHPPCRPPSWAALGWFPLPSASRRHFGWSHFLRKARGETGRGAAGACEQAGHRFLEGH